MSYKLTVNDNSEVEAIMSAGSSFVKISIPEGKAKGLIESSDKIEKSDKFEGFEICVENGKYYIAGTFQTEEKKPEPKEEVASDNTKFDSNKDKK